MRLDHVLVSGFGVQDVSVVEIPDTDHRAVITRLTMS
jgi:endonuclease/exonuclease/phosphatase (EEP) superfamily protein YafD